MNGLSFLKKKIHPWLYYNTKLLFYINNTKIKIMLSYALNYEQIPLKKCMQIWHALKE